jgi:hypothetical protein
LSRLTLSAGADKTILAELIEWPYEILMVNSSYSDFTAVEAEWNNGEGDSSWPEDL